MRGGAAINKDDETWPERSPVAMLPTLSSSSSLSQQRHVIIIQQSKVSHVTVATAPGTKEWIKSEPQIHSNMPPRPVMLLHALTEDSSSRIWRIPTIVLAK